MSVRKVVLSVAAAAGLSMMTSTAFAADLRGAPPVSYSDNFAPAPYAYNWSGFYLGGHIGAGWLNGDGSINVPAAATSFDDSAFLGGVQGGFNWQSGNWVFGGEVDYSWTTLEVSRSFPTPATQYSGSVGLDGMGSVRARIGWATGPALLYVTGGLAFADVNVAHGFAAGAASNSASNSDWATGWTIGGGIEYMVTNNWTLRGEYRYADYGDVSVTRPAGAAGAASTANYDITTHELRMGLNYKF